MKQKVRLNIERACNWSSQRIIKVIIYKLTSLEEYVGFCIDLLDLFKEKMKNETEKKNNETGGNGTEFEFEIYEAPGGHRAYGRRNEKGEWDGLIGELVNKKADFALGAISVMAELEDVVDFTVPYYDLVGYSILRKIPDDPVRLFMFMSVMDVSVSFSILLAFFITSVVMWIRHVQKTPFFMDPHARLTKGGLLVPRTLVCL